MAAWESAGKSDEWYTPKYIFDALGCMFDMDVAAPAGGPIHVPCDEWISSDSIEKEWRGFVWMNPPYGGRNGFVPWLQKFFIHGNGIALTPDRTSAPWFHYAWQRSDAVLFTRKIKFIRPDGSLGKSPSTGSALIAVGDRAVEALYRARDNNLGILAECKK